MAAYVEVFNASQSEYKVEILFDADLHALITEGETGADLVIGRGLAAPAVMGKLAPLDSLLETEDLGAEDFYEALLESGRSGDSQLLLPVSFELPLVVFDQRRLESIPDTYFSPADIRERASQFDDPEAEIYRKVGFSPTWETFFLYHVALLGGVSFSESQDGEIEWDRQLLDEIVKDLTGWLEELDRVRLTEFDDTYMQIPDYQVLNDGRILFYVTTPREFLSIPPEKRTNLDFRWLGQADQLPVLEDLLFAGILRERRNRRGARAFMSWFFTADTQVILMGVNQYKRLTGVYGLAGGLPALREVTLRELPKPEHYPVFVGHLPPEEYLKVQRERPDGWLGLRDTVVIPWMLEAVEGKADQEALRERVARHQSSQNN
jgi:hypothetical protein